MAKRAVSRTFDITMGQAFRDSLRTACRELGARVWTAKLDSSSTLVTVRATFSGKTARQVQDALWRLWPACSIGVEETKR